MRVEVGAGGAAQAEEPEAQPRPRGREEGRGVRRSVKGHQVLPPSPLSFIYETVSPQWMLPLAWLLRGTPSTRQARVDIRPPVTYARHCPGVPQSLPDEPVLVLPFRAGDTAPAGPEGGAQGFPNLYSWGLRPRGRLAAAGPQGGLSCFSGHLPSLSALQPPTAPRESRHLRVENPTPEYRQRVRNSEAPALCSSQKPSQ